MSLEVHLSLQRVPFWVPCWVHWLVGHSSSVPGSGVTVGVGLTVFWQLEDALEGQAKQFEAVKLATQLAAAEK